jgi:hypothetical protein
MKGLIVFDYRIAWQEGSPAEHGSPAELCFKARLGTATVICRVPSRALWNASSALGGVEPDIARAEECWDSEERHVCEALFDRFRRAFRSVAEDKIASGAFALPIGHVQSVLIEEGELIRKAREMVTTH